MELRVKRLNPDEQNHAYRETVLQSLIQFRKEWQSLAEGRSLIDVESSIGLVLCDIAERLALTPYERSLLLGLELSEQLGFVVNQPLDLRIMQ